jgi:hypothetical protein
MHTKKWMGAPLLVALLVALALLANSASSQTTCPEGCKCLSEAKAKEAFGEGNYQPCQSAPCGKEQLPSGATVPEYCFKPLCPQSCACMTAEEAKAKHYTPCSTPLQECGKDRNGNIRYCFSAQAPCPPECSCLTDAQAKEMGYTDLCQNRRTECGKDPSGVVKFCYQIPVSSCPSSWCLCLSKDEAAAQGLTEYCMDSAGKPVLCGILNAEAGEFKYCFNRQTQGQCRYDFNLNQCVGQCQPNTKCQLNNIIRDPKTGKVKSAECHCK